MHAEKPSLRDFNKEKLFDNIAFLNVDYLSKSTFFDVESTVEKKTPDLVFLFETYRTLTFQDIQSTNV